MSIYEYSLKTHMDWEKEVYMVKTNSHDSYEKKDKWHTTKEHD